MPRSFIIPVRCISQIHNQEYSSTVWFWEYEDEDDVRESEYVPVTERRLLEQRSTIKEGKCKQLLQKVILEGLPEDKTHLDPDVRPYFNFQNKMTVQEEFIFTENE